MAARSWGRIVGVFGDPIKGINAETARLISEAARSVPVGDGGTSIVAGPMDVGTSDGVVDPLLKILEEPHPHFPRVFMWAWDLGEVRPTVRSRSLDTWCPGRLPGGTEAGKRAADVLRGFLARDTLAVTGSMLDLKDGWSEEGAVFLRALPQSVLDVLRTSDAGGVEWRRAVGLWSRIRPLAGVRNVSWYEALATVLP